MEPKLITASRFNETQQRVATILGVGASNSGYGQLLQSNRATSKTVITAEQLNLLRRDMLAIYVHQTGEFDSFILPAFAGQSSNSSPADLITETDFLDYENFSFQLLENRNNYEELISFVENNVHQSSLSIFNNFTTFFKVLKNTRSQSWGGEAQPQTVFHEFRVIFDSADQRRHFFNTGGQIRFEASLDGFFGNQPELDKFNSWQNLLNDMGQIIFTGDKTIKTGTGQGSNLGNFSLTEQDQLIFVRDGSGIYSENSYSILARNVSSSVISFTVRFNDGQTSGAPGAPVSEYGLDVSVKGVLTSLVHHLRATGTNFPGVSKVISPTPRYQTVKNL